jgi:hypothetical protein
MEAALLQNVYAGCFSQPLVVPIGSRFNRAFRRRAEKKQTI